MPLQDYKKAKANLRERLNVAHILDSAIFTTMVGGAEGEPYDERTVFEIKRKFANWFHSWIEEDLELILK